MNKQEVATLVGVLAAGFPQWQVTKETVAVWADILSDLDYEPTRAVVRDYLMTEDRPPSPAAIRRRVGEKLGLISPTKALAWSEVTKGIHTSESGYRPSFSHPAISKTVEALGWYEIRTSTNIDTIRAQFFRMYEDFASQEDRKVLTDQVALSAPKTRLELENA